MVLTLEELSKVQVTCMHKDLDAVLSSFYGFGAIQVTQSKVNVPDVPRPTFQRISEELIALRSYEKALDITAAVEEKQFGRQVSFLVEESAKIRREYAKVEAAQSALSEARSAQTQLEGMLVQFSPLRSVSFSPKLIRASSKLDFIYCRVKGNAAKIKEACLNLGCELMFATGQEGTFMLAAVDKRKVEEFHAKTAGMLGPQIPIPQTILQEDTFAKAIWSIEDSLNSSIRRQAEAKRDVEEFVGKYSTLIAQYCHELELAARIAELPNKFSKSTHLNFAEGWIQKSRFQEFSDAIDKATEGKSAVEIISTKEIPPSKLNNPPVIRRFEFLLKFFSLPKSNELDPTAFIAFTFPIIFGMILGDIGYGLLGLLLAALIYTRSKADFLKSISAMMLLSSLTTIFFGFIYGEFFGASSLFGITLHPILERGGDGIPLLMAAAIILGSFHLALGFIIGIYSNAVHKHYNHAIGKFCWLLLEIAMIFLGGLLLAPSLISAFLLHATPGTLQSVFGALAAIAVVGIVVFEGAVALVEIPTLIANILSYLRIMALGLSGAILARIIDTVPVGSALSTLVATVTLHSFNPVAFIVALVTLIAFCALMILGQVLAFVLGFFESSIQTLRLHYVEFFSKFYKGGGLPFTPLRETN